MKFSVFEVTRYLLIFTMVVLIALGMASLLRIEDNPDGTALYIFYSAVFFADALLFGFCVWQLTKRTRFVFFFSVLVLAANIIPIVFDQFGLADLLFVLLNVATLVFLINARKEILHA